MKPSAPLPENVSDPGSRRLGPPPVALGVVGAAVSLCLLLPILVANDWDPTLLVAFGEESHANLAYAESLLGEVDARPSLGHDGRFFFAQAIDPWLNDPETLRSVLDLPAYRTQRMLYPMLAGFFGIASAPIVVWTLVALNIFSFGVGTWATALVARGMGASSAWGAAFVLNLGMISELLVSGGGVVALAAALVAVAALQRNRFGFAVVALAASVLSREVMLLSALGIALWLFRRGRRLDAAVAAAVPTAAVLAWAGYVRSRFGWEVGTEQVQGIGVPMKGVFEAVGVWRNEPIDLAVGLLVISILVVFSLRAIQRDWLVGWMALGFVPLSLLLSRAVWLNYFDISRGVAPVITAFILVSFAGARWRATDTLEGKLSR